VLVLHDIQIEKEVDMDFPEFKPADKQSELEAFYSKHKVGANGMPTAAWESENLTTFTTAYPLKLAFPPGTRVTKIRCHVKVADSLARVFEQILEHYGSVAEIEKARMHLFAGCFNFRLIGGASRLSTHSWGAGIDIDSEKNPRGKKHDESKGMMPMAVVRIFEAEGWKWGGRFTTIPDCMHFQATK
jgi:D-alanyl-D-alanine carboxypeptidase-like protein